MADGEHGGVTGAFRRAVDGALGATVSRVGDVALNVTEGSAKQVIIELEPFIIDELVPKVVDGVTPYLVEVTVPQILTGATPELVDRLIPQLLEQLQPYLQEQLVPQIVDAVTDHIVEVVAPAIVDGVTPHIIAVTAPAIVDGVMPKIRAEVVPAILEDIVDDPRVGGLIREQSQGLFFDGLERLRRVVAGADYLVENVVRRLAGKGPRPAPAIPPPPGRSSRYAGFVSRGLALVIDLSLAAFVFGVTLSSLANVINNIFDPAPSWVSPLFTVVAFALTPTYLGLAWCTFGRSVGDAVVGVRQVHTGGGRLHFWPAMVKAWIGLMFLPLWVVGMIPSAFNARRQGWLDKLTRSEVLYVWRVIWEPPEDEQIDASEEAAALAEAGAQAEERARAASGGDERV